MTDTAGSLLNPESLDDWIKVVYQFRVRTLPKAAWTHTAHLVVALWYLCENREAGREALSRTLCNFRADLILYNEAIGVKNNWHSGYHETITIFWLRCLYNFQQQQKIWGFDKLVSDLLKGEDSHNSAYINEFYTEDVLKSQQARIFYVPPNLGNHWLPFP